MRAFVAIDLPGPLHTGLDRVQQTFRSVCPDARWTNPEGIHLTLKFLGEITEAQAKQVVEILAPIGATFAAFRVEVKGFGFFPDARRPRVFWTGVEAPPALTELAACVDGALEKVGFLREPRAYSPHLTMARFRVPRPQPEMEAALARYEATMLGGFEVTEFYLFESKLSAEGAQYRKVARFPRLPRGEDKLS